MVSKVWKVPGDVTEKVKQKLDKKQMEAQLRKLREMPFAKVKVKKPQGTKVIIGVSSALSMLALGYVVTKLGGNKVN
ncbi:MAG: hypothetical protein CVU86_03950 [Firmicutes bacterium HGW-Firmicutes-11]|nr:MAG: hypothetical protein CVU86_03950 [Firmicutes bacterium HGW-Firmicutes-11]